MKDYGRRLLLAQRRCHGPALYEAPPQHFTEPMRRAWADVLSAAPPGVTRAIDAPMLAVAASQLHCCRELHSHGLLTPSDLRLCCKLLREFFIQRDARRRLLYPKE